MDRRFTPMTIRDVVLQQKTLFTITGTVHGSYHGPYTNMVSLTLFYCYYY